MKNFRPLAHSVVMLPLVTSLGLAGCGEENEFQEFAGQGIYDVVSYEISDGSCETLVAEPVPDGHTLLSARNEVETILGFTGVATYFRTCTDESECGVDQVDANGEKIRDGLRYRTIELRGESPWDVERSAIIYKINDQQECRVGQSRLQVDFTDDQLTVVAIEQQLVYSPADGVCADDVRTNPPVPWTCVEKTRLVANGRRDHP